MNDLLKQALERMDRARNILTDGNPRPECSWLMLDTSDLRAAIEAAQAQPPNQGDTHHWPQQGDTTWPAQPVGVPDGWKRLDPECSKILADNLHDLYTRDAPLPVDEKVQPLQEWHQHQCATNYFAHAKCDCSAAAPAAKVELPVVAQLLQQCRGSVKTDMSQWERLALTAFTQSVRDLANTEASRLQALLAAIDAQAAIAAQGEKP